MPGEGFVCFSGEILELPLPVEISTVRMQLRLFKPTVQTVQPERIAYLLEQLLGRGVKQP